VTPTAVRPQLDRPAPALDLVDAEGRRWRSSDHRGETLVVIFHRHIH
jgi:peroxiredoxin